MKIIKKYSKKTYSRKVLSAKLKSVSEKNRKKYLLNRALLWLNYLWVIGAFLAVEVSVINTWPNVIRILISIFLAALFTILYSALIMKTVRYEKPYTLEEKARVKFFAPLRAYYGIRDEYITTKCYHSTEERFNKKDVLLYWYGDELRITVDLFHFANDVGCCVIPKNAFTFLNIKENGLICTVIKSNDFEMTLGHRAGTFLKKTQI